MSIFDRALTRRVAGLEQRVTQLEKKEQLDMGTNADQLAKLKADVAALPAAQQQLAADLTAQAAMLATINTNVTQLIADFKAQAGNQPTLSAADVNAMLTTLEGSTAGLGAVHTQLASSATTLQGIADTTKASDPGAPTPTPVNA